MTIEPRQLHDSKTVVFQNQLNNHPDVDMNIRWRITPVCTYANCFRYGSLRYTSDFHFINICQHCLQIDISHDNIPF